MSKNLRSYLLSYGAAIVAVIAATLFRIALEPIVGAAVPFVTYVAAAILLAWYRGFWPAALGVALSAWIGSHFVLTSGATGLLTSGRSEHAAVFGFLLISLTVSFLIDFQRRTLARAKSAEQAQTAIAFENARLLKQAELATAQLEQSNDELRRANRDLELFAYSASHDLQEPLRTITISAQLIARTYPQVQSNSDSPDFVQQILTASRRMNSLLQDLLAYIGAAKIDSEPAPKIDANRVFREVVERLQGSIIESGAVVESGELPTLSVHENRLAQLLQNLISNAIKYRGTERPHIRVDAAVRDGACVFAVADNGIGIDPKFSEQIFGLFKRLHNQDRYQGSGIGLAICQRIVEQYGGRIWLERSEPGMGSTFCFSVPVSVRTTSASAQEMATYQGR